MSEKTTNQVIKETYNKLLSDPNEDYSHHRWFREAISRYHHKQSKRSFLYALEGCKYGRALEIGGGDGQWTKILLDYADYIDFYDISEGMLNRAKQKLSKHSNINFILGDFSNNELIDKIYDLILSFRSFEYFEDKPKFIKDAYRLLKDKGEIIIVTKSPKYDWRGYYKTKKIHSDILPIKELIKMLEENGFEIELVKPAIVGKKLSWPLMRFLFDIFHSSNYLFKFNILPLFILQYISESFIIRVVKK